MKKNLLVIIIIALFICTNMATFLFAHGRVRIIEKVMTVYKEAKEPNYAASLDAGTVQHNHSRRDDGLERAVEIREDRRYFNNADRSIGSRTNDRTRDISAAKVPPVVDELLNRPEEPTQHGGAFYPNSSTPQTSEFSSADDDPIPMPQLPLWGGDFEVATSEDDFRGTPPPVLPSLDDLQ